MSSIATCRPTCCRSSRTTVARSISSGTLATCMRNDAPLAPAAWSSAIASARRSSIGVDRDEASSTSFAGERPVAAREMRVHWAERVAVAEPDAGDHRVAIEREVDGAADARVGERRPVDAQAERQAGERRLRIELRSCENARRSRASARIVVRYRVDVVPLERGELVVLLLVDGPLHRVEVGQRCAEVRVVADDPRAVVHRRPIELKRAAADGDGREVGVGVDQLAREDRAAADRTQLLQRVGVRTLRDDAHGRGVRGIDVVEDRGVPRLVA